MSFAKVSVFILLLATTVYCAEDDKAKPTKNVEQSSLLGLEINEKDSEVELIDESTSETSADSDETIHEKETKKKKVFTTTKPMNPDVKHSCDEEDTTMKTTSTTINPFVEVFNPVEKTVEVPLKLNKSENEKPEIEPSNIFVVRLEQADPIISYIFHQRHIPVFHLLPVNYLYPNYYYYYDPYFTQYYNPHDLYDLRPYEYKRPILLYNNYLHRHIIDTNKNDLYSAIHTSNNDNEFAESHNQHIKYWDF